jgi:uncharacterized protein DUF4258
MASDDPSSQAVVRRFLPRPDALERNIKAIAKNSDQIDWSLHAFDQMEDRGISTDDVLEVLRTGSVKGGVEAGKNPGEWKLKMVKVLVGRRDCGVVTIVKRNNRLWIKTAEWEDWK